MLVYCLATSSPACHKKNYAKGLLDKYVTVSDTDIDECAEGNSGCDPLRENCTNLIGGVSCHCLPEYVRVEGECQCE